MTKQIVKRDGRIENFDQSKIYRAIKKAFISTRNSFDDTLIKNLVNKINDGIVEETISVEEIQDLVEKFLMENNYFDVARNYIFYRENRNKIRQYRYEIAKLVPSYNIYSILKEFQKDNTDLKYSLENLLIKYNNFDFFDLDEKGKLLSLVRSCDELCNGDALEWSYLGYRLFSLILNDILKENYKKFDCNSFKKRLNIYINKFLFSRDLLSYYDEKEIDLIEKSINKSRDRYINLSKFRNLFDNYLVKMNGNLIMSPQELFIFLAMQIEKKASNNKLENINKTYEAISKGEITLDNNFLLSLNKRN
ncbi:MAG TPA: hypothetical protein DEA28_02670 [Firmicutes bacterium]|nr:hypothetical protein [Bacillota bacterium]